MMTLMTVVDRIRQERSTASCGPGQWSWDPVLLLARGEVIFLTNNLTVTSRDGPTNSTLGPNQPNILLDWGTNGEQIISRNGQLTEDIQKELSEQVIQVQLVKECKSIVHPSEAATPRSRGPGRASQPSPRLSQLSSNGMRLDQFSPLAHAPDPSYPFLPPSKVRSYLWIEELLVNAGESCLSPST